MTENGYIKLHRSILNWEWWQDENTRNVFLWLLLNANWEDSRFQGYEVPKGSLVTSYNSIAEKLRITPRNARTAIKHLKSTGEVTIKVTSHFSIVSIANWEKYQCYENEVTSKVTSKVSGKCQASDNIKEYKEYKEYKKNGFKNFTQSNYDWEEINRELGIK